MDRLSPWPCQSCIAHDLRISPGRPRNTFMYTDTALWSFSLVAIRRYSRSTRLSAVGLFCIRRRRQVTESPSSFGKPPNQKPASQERMPFFGGGVVNTINTHEDNKSVRNFNQFRCRLLTSPRLYFSFRCGFIKAAAPAVSKL